MFFIFRRGVEYSSNNELSKVDWDCVKATDSFQKVHICVNRFYFNNDKNNFNNITFRRQTQLLELAPPGLFEKRLLERIPDG